MALTFEDLLPTPKQAGSALTFDDLVQSTPPQGSMRDAPPAVDQTQLPTGGEAVGAAFGVFPQLGRRRPEQPPAATFNAGTPGFSVMGDAPTPAVPIGVNPDFVHQTRGELMRMTPEQRMVVANAGDLRARVAQAVMAQDPQLFAPRSVGSIQETPLSARIAMDARRAVPNPIAGGVLAGVAGLGQVVPGVVQGAADLVGADDVSQFAGAVGQTAQNFARTQRQGRAGAEAVAFDIFNSITQSSPSILAGLGLGTTQAMNVLFGQSLAQNYNERRNAGFDPLPSAAGATIHAAAEVLGERLGFGEQMQLLRNVTRGVPVEELAPVLARSMVKDMTGEQLTTLTQFLNEKYGPAAMNPEAGLTQYLEQAGQTALVSLGQSGIMSGGPAAISAAQDLNARNAQRDAEAAAFAQARELLGVRPAATQPEATPAPEATPPAPAARPAMQSAPAGSGGFAAVPPAAAPQAGPVPQPLTFDDLVGSQQQEANEQVEPPTQQAVAPGEVVAPTNEGGALPGAAAPGGTEQPVGMEPAGNEPVEAAGVEAVTQPAPAKGGRPLTPDEELLKRVDSNAEEFGLTVAQESAESDFDPNEIPTALAQWIEQYNLPAQQFTEAVIASIEKRQFRRKAGVLSALRKLSQQATQPAPAGGASVEGAGESQPTQVATPPDAVELSAETIAQIQSGVASLDPDMRDLWATQLQRKLDRRGSLQWTDIPDDLANALDTISFGGLKTALQQNPAQAISLVRGEAGAQSTQVATPPDAVQGQPGSALDGVIEDLPPEVQAKFREAEKLANDLGWQVAGGSPNWPWAVRAYREIVARGTPADGDQAIEQMFERIQSESRDRVLGEATRAYIDQFAPQKVPADSQIVNAVRRGLLDVSNQPWASAFYRVFKIDPATIPRQQAAQPDDRVAQILTRMRAGTLTQPSLARASSSASPEDKAAIDEQNAKTLEAYREAARQFLEGDLPTAKPGKDQSLDVSLQNELRGIQPKPIEKSAPRAKTWTDTLKAVSTLAAKGDIRYYLNGIHMNVEAGRLEVTDGFRAMVYKTDLTGRLPDRPDGVEEGSSTYVGVDGQWPRTKIGATEGPISGRFPDLNRIIPGRQGRTRAVTVNAADLAARARGNLTAAKQFGTKVNYPVTLQIDNTTAAFDPQFIVDIGDVFRRLGYDSVEIDLAQPEGMTSSLVSQALRARSPDGKLTMVVMPRRLADGEVAGMFTPVVLEDQAAPATPRRAPATRRRKTANEVVREVLAEQGVTPSDDVITEIVNEFNALSTDGTSLEDFGQGGQERGQPTPDERSGDSRRDIDPAGEQGELLQGAAQDGGSAPSQDAPRAGDQPAANRVDDTPAGNQRVRGAGAAAFTVASMTQRASIYRDAVEDLGIEPATFDNLPPVAQFNLLAKQMTERYGLSLVERTERANLREAIDQLLDAHRNLQFMAAVLGLPAKAIGLNGSLAMVLRGQGGGYLGAYYPEGMPGNRGTEGMRTTTPTISMPGRSNSFAHEWGHAFDYFVGQKVGGTPQAMTSYVRDGESLSDKMPETTADAWRLLMNAMFFDRAEMATRIFDLERRIEAAALRGVDAKALKAELDKLVSGASQSPAGRSKFFRDARDYAARVGGNAAYWTKPTEMLARAFEAYVSFKVEAAGGTTEFIGKSDEAYQSDADDRLAMTFPRESDRLNIFRAFDLLFDGVRQDAYFGDEPSADVPAGATRLTGPEVWFATSAAEQQMSWVKRIAQSERDAIAQHKYEARQRAKRPKPVGTLLERVEDSTRSLVETNRGVLLALEDRYRRRGKAAAAEAINEVRKRIASDPGAGRETFQGGTFAEAVDRQTKIYLNRLSSVIERLNAKRLTDAEMAELTRVLTALDASEAKASTPRLAELSLELRSLLTDAYYYSRAAGLDVGFVKDQGYLPRLMDEALVAERAPEFVQAAARVYRIVYEREVASPSDALVNGLDAFSESLKAIEARARRAFGDNWQRAASMAGYMQLRAEVRRLLRALNKAEQSGDGDAMDNAQAALNQFLEENASGFDEAWNEVGDAWSQAAASDWQTRIVYGSPLSFSSHSPAGDFMKSRVLPKEADRILQEFYIENPVERLTTYLQQAVRKAEFNRRFGYTEAGGNTMLHQLLERMVEGGVERHDRDMVESIVAQVTGTDQSSLSFATQKMLGNIHAIGQMSLLGRVVLTSLAEPITVAVQTGRWTDAFRSFGLTLQELANTRSVEDRRALANAIGIVSGDLSAEMIANRLGGTVGQNVRMQQVSANFFRRIGLTGLTNAQRRSAMALAGRYVLDMAHSINAKPGSPEAGFARAELLDAGMAESEITDFVQWSLQFESRLPRVDELMDERGNLTRMGQAFSVSVGRLVNQSIQNPSAIDRPWAANTVVGRLTYGLLSFTMAFFRNVAIKSWKKIARTAEQQGLPAATKVALAQVAAPIMMLYLGHLLTTMLREAILNPDRWEEESQKAGGGLPIAWLASLAFSRSGFTGIADPLYNAILAVKFQIDLANIAIGPSLSFFLRAAQRVLFSLQQNSENTNTAERNIARGIFELSIQPAMAVATGMAPVGAAAGYGMGLAYAIASAPWGKDKWQDWLAGERDGRQKRAGESRQEGL